MELPIRAPDGTAAVVAERPFGVLGLSQFAEQSVRALPSPASPSCPKASLFQHFEPSGDSASRLPSSPIFGEARVDELLLVRLAERDEHHAYWQW